MHNLFEEEKISIEYWEGLQMPPLKKVLSFLVHQTIYLLSLQKRGEFNLLV